MLRFVFVIFFCNHATILAEALFNQTKKIKQRKVCWVLGSSTQPFCLINAAIFFRCLDHILVPAAMPLPDMVPAPPQVLPVVVLVPAAPPLSPRVVVGVVAALPAPPCCCPPGTRIVGDDSMGRCLITTRAFVADEVVSAETPILLSPESLPPIALFAPLDATAPVVGVFDHGSVLLVRSDVIEKDAGCSYDSVEAPTSVVEQEQSPVARAEQEKKFLDLATLSALLGRPTDFPQTCSLDPRVVGLVYEFMCAEEEIQNEIVGLFQNALEEKQQNCGPSALCRAAAVELAKRGAPFHQDDPEKKHLLETVLRIFVVNGHSACDSKRAAFFPLLSKMAHSCHDANCDYHWNADLKKGVVRALRKIAIGELLTVNYLGTKLSNLSTGHRRRLLYQRLGFVCRCGSCQQGGQEEDLDEVVLRGRAVGSKGRGGFSPLCSAQHHVADVLVSTRERAAAHPDTEIIPHIFTNVRPAQARS